jgi:hypothetical protein
MFERDIIFNSEPPNGEKKFRVWTHCTSGCLIMSDYIPDYYDVVYFCGTWFKINSRIDSVTCGSMIYTDIPYGHITQDEMLRFTSSKVVFQKRF